MKLQSTSRIVRRTALSTACLAVASVVISASPAQAVANDAVTGCGAKNVKAGVSATVPTAVQYSTFRTINSTKGTFPIKCGDGREKGFGAVHIEVKHKVPNWPDAMNCIKKVLEHGKTVPSDPGKLEFQRLVPGTLVLVVVVTGPDGIVTAYPQGNNEAADWLTCSRYA